MENNTKVVSKIAVGSALIAAGMSYFIGDSQTF